MPSGSQRIVRGFDLHEKLKEHKPGIVHAFDEHDEKVIINVPEVKQRHARVMSALREVPWIRVDLLDKKGGLLHRHHRCADDRDNVSGGELEDLGNGTGGTLRGAELATMLGLMLKAQEVALIRQQQGVQQLLDAQNRLMDSMMRRQDAQDQRHEQAMQMNHALSADLVNAQLGQLQLGPAPVDENGEAKPASNSDRALAAFLPAFMRAAMDKKPDAIAKADKPAKPKNGANGASSETNRTERQAPPSSAPTE